MTTLLKLAIGSAVLRVGLLAQTGAPAAAPHSWSGLLVAQGCQATAGSGVSRSEPQAGDLSRSTPAPASRQQNRPYEQQVSQADRNNPGRQTTPSPELSSGADNPNVAAAMDSTCRIGDHTNAFALRLNDGTVLSFDEASNTKIAEQIKSSGKAKQKTKVFRVVVKGTEQSGVIQANSVKL